MIELYNKHKAPSRAGGPNAKKAEEPKEQYELTYDIPNSSTIILSCVNDKNDWLYIVLDKIKKQYPLVKAN